MIEADGRTVAEVLASIENGHPGFRFRIIDEQDQIREHIKIFVNEEQIRNLEAPVRREDVVHIICGLSGGAPPVRAYN